MPPSMNFQMPAFLKQLCKILENEDVSIIGWTVDGLAFQVRDTNAFEEILPKYFNHGKYASFNRQLNYFGFSKSTHFAKITYIQTNFQRDQPELMLYIQRKTKNVAQIQRETKLASDTLLLIGRIRAPKETSFMPVKSYLNTYQPWPGFFSNSN